MSLVDIKTAARSALHQAMGVSGVYTSPEDVVTPSDAQATAGLVLRVRWHNKLERNGAIEGAFNAEIIEGINRLVFQSDNLAALGLELEQDGVVVIAGYNNARFQLDTEEPSDGPLNVYWNVSRQV